MKPSRRAFIAVGVAAPIAAAIPAVDVVTLPIEPPTPVQTPYTEYPWRWMVSSDDYSYSEEFETFAKAIEHAKAVGAEIVAECQMQDFYLGVTGDDVLEMLQGQNEDLIGEGEFIEATKEQADDLGKMVTEAIEHWAVKHRISLTAWTFAGVRNKQRLPDIA
jgi:hypothetical protein